VICDVMSSELLGKCHTFNMEFVEKSVGDVRYLNIVQYWKKKIKLRTFDEVTIMMEIRSDGRKNS
jgi:hypothetical protein